MLPTAPFLRFYVAEGVGGYLPSVMFVFLWQGGYGSLLSPCSVFIMTQGRESEATEAVFCLLAKRPLHSGSYEYRVPIIKNKHYSVPGMFA